MKFYLSHAIRGKAGPDASHDVQVKNCTNALRVANIIRRQFPKLVLYVPAENETFVQIAYDSGHLSEKQILDIDCKIIDNMDGVLVYVPENDELQGGRKIEHDHAVTTNKPVCVFRREYEVINWLTGQYRRELI